jgi:MFS family permease
LYLGGFLGPFGGGVVVAMLPELGASFGVGPVAAATSLSAFLLPFGLLMLVSGALGERWGAQRTVRVAYLVYLAASIGCVVAGSTGAFPAFLAGRVVQGLANSFTLPLLLATIAAVTPPQRLGRALGLYGSLNAAGQTSAPLIGGLAAEVDWRWAFAGVAAVALGCAIAGLPSTAGAAAPAPATSGSATSGSATSGSATSGSATSGSATSGSEPSSGAESACGAGPAPGERPPPGAGPSSETGPTPGAGPSSETGPTPGAAPGRRLGAWSPVVLRAGLVAGVGWGALGGLSYLVALRMQDVFGLGAGMRGALLTAFGMAGVLTAGLVGRMIDRVGPHRCGRWGAMAGAVLMAGVGASPSLPLLAGLWALAGVASQFVLVGLNALVLTSVDADRRGGAVSMVQALRFLGGGAAPAVVTPVYGLAPLAGFLLPAALLAAATALIPRRNGTPPR